MTPMRPTDGRARRTQRTHGDLIEACAALMRAGAVPAAGEIARQADVSRSTLFRHFPALGALHAAGLQRALNKSEVKSHIVSCGNIPAI